MEDPKRAEKLSAARKLLKEHQKKSKKPVDNVPPDNASLAGAGVDISPQDGSAPSLIPDVETSSVVSSEGSCYNAVASNIFDHTAPAVPDAQHFFDQIPPTSSYNGFMSSNPTISGASEILPETNNHGILPSTNNQNMTDAIANYHQYYNLYIDATQKIHWYEQQLESTKLFGEQRLNQAVAELQEKIQFQCRSIEIALSEKSELQRQFDSLLEESKAKNASCEELTNRLKASRNHVARLEKELVDLQEARTQHNSILKKLETNVQEHKQTADRYRSELDEAKQEIVEIKKSLDSAGSEHAVLEKKLIEKESQLSLALIKIQQLGGDSPESVTSQSGLADADVETFNQRIAELTKENEQTSQQYQEYINNLNLQLQETTAMYESTLVVNNEQMERISSLVDHVSDLEKQIQKSSANIPPSVDYKEKNNELQHALEVANKRILEVESELNDQKTKSDEMIKHLGDSRNEIGLLEDRFERLKGEVPDAKLLQAAMESDKIAAARAISQNTQLKQQLQELQDAYIKLQNTKLELTEQLDHMKHQYTDCQTELTSYIKKEVSRSDSGTEMNRVPVVDGCCQTTYYDLDANKSGVAETVTPEAAALLEDKFRSTMNKLAQVLDEKQVLEHLVTKLQSETETIGEYVALYQMQRCKLEKREFEKDQVVAAISKEKEELRAKLAEITALIPSLLNREPRVSVGEEAVVTEDITVEVKETTEVNEAATKIMSLLSEIGTSNLVKETIHSQENCNTNFHPCALCSGSLITV